MSTAKNYCPVNLLSVVSKVFEKLVNNRLVDHLEKCRLFSDFRYGFRFSCSSAGLLTVLTVLEGAVALDVYKALGGVLHAGLFQKLKSYGISG